MALSNFHGGAIGVLMQPLEAMFGWSRAEISMSVLFICLGALILGPIVGVVIGRVGARRVSLFGIVAFSAAVCGVGLSGPSIVSWYVAWAFVGLTYPLVGTVVWTLGVGRAFDKQRGLAFGLTISGVGIAGFFSPLFTVALLPIVGWRGVFVVFGVGGLLIGWPLIWFLFHPDRLSRHPPPSSIDHRPALTGHSVAEILKSARFWSLAVAAVLLAAAVGGLSLHLQPIMRDAGLSAAKAAGYAALLGPSSIAGHLVVGRLLDRYPARYVAAAFFATPAIVCAILLHYDASPVLSLVVVVVLGIAQGIEGDIIAYLTARYFGLRQYGVAFAILIGMYSLGWGLSPVIAGAVFDALGSYDAMLKLLIVGLLVSVVLVLRLGRPPTFEAGSDPTHTHHDAFPDDLVEEAIRPALCP